MLHNMSFRAHARFGLLSPLLLLTLVGVGCNKVPEPTPRDEQSTTQPAVASASMDTTVKAGGDATDTNKSATPSNLSDTPAQSPRASAVTAGDPEEGNFTLDEALAGLPGKGSPSAEIETEMGLLNCELFADKAPLTVANFVGLARGTRAWKNPKGEWVKQPAYDGTLFHRIIKGFMIQGGDPEGTGRGGPGYVFKDEVWEGAKHDRRGLLCMANRGPNTNGAQFFILDGPAPHLDNSFTIFGQCKPEGVIEKLASVTVQRDRPEKPPVIKRITIKRN